MADLFHESGDLNNLGVPAPFLQGGFYPAIDSPPQVDGFGESLPLGGGATAPRMNDYGVSAESPSNLEAVVSQLAVRVDNMQVPNVSYNFTGLLGPQGPPGPIGPTAVPVIVTNPMEAPALVDFGKPVVSSSISWTDDSPSAGYVAWTAGTVTLGTAVYNVTAGNTNLEFIYWDSSSPTTFQSSNTQSDGVGLTKWFIARNSSGTALPVYEGTKLFDGQILIDASVNANQIAAAAITAAKTSLPAINNSTGNLNSLTVDEAQLIDSAVSAAKTNLSAISNSTGNLNANTVDTNQLVADAVTATELDVVGINGTTGRIVVADATDANTITSGVNTHASTFIQPGKIVISGATNLSDWRNATDATKIEGGSIYTNTIGTTQLAADAVTATELNVVGINGTTGRIIVADATDANVVTSGVNSYATTLINAGKIFVGTAANLLSDRILQYKLEDTAASTTVTDDVGSYNGTIVGGKNASNLTTTGYDNLGFDMDGAADSISAGSSFQTQFQSSFTICMWIKPDDGVPVSNEALFGARHDVSGTEDTVQGYLLDTGKIHFRYMTAGNAGNVAVTDAPVFADGAASNWVHLAFVADSTIGGVGGKKIYVNAQEATLDSSFDGSTSGVTFSSYASTRPLYFCARNNEGTVEGWFDGKVDDIHFYSKALSTAEISSVMTLNYSGASINVDDWASGTDATLIDGGKIYTGSIMANALAANSITTQHLMAGSITANEINANAITTAKINALNVTTAKIADDATKITNSGQGTNTTTSSSSWTDVCSVAITSDGGTVDIFAQAQVSNVDVGVDQRVRVYNSTDTTTVFEQEYSPNAPTLFMSQACVEIPGSGSHTYKIQMKADGSNSFTCSSIYLSLSESKGK